MKLYYSPLSVYSTKPRIAMFEKAIAHETRLVNWTPGTGWIKPEELPRLNPKAQIFVLLSNQHRVVNGGRTVSRVQQPDELARANDETSERRALPGGIFRGDCTVESTGPGGIRARVMIQRTIPTRR